MMQYNLRIDILDKNPKTLGGAMHSIGVPLKIGLYKQFNFEG
jgi:hypothetical protein